MARTVQLARVGSSAKATIPVDKVIAVVDSDAPDTCYVTLVSGDNLLVKGSRLEVASYVFRGSSD